MQHYYSTNNLIQSNKHNYKQTHKVNPQKPTRKKTTHKNLNIIPRKQSQITLNRKHKATIHSSPSEATDNNIKHSTLIPNKYKHPTVSTRKQKTNNQLNLNANSQTHPYKTNIQINHAANHNISNNRNNTNKLNNN